MPNRLFVSIIIAAIIALSTTIIHAQPSPAADETCPVFVNDALALLADNCDALDRNSACYGFNQVFASFAEAVGPDTFVQPSDRVALTLLQTIQTAPLDLALERWGIAVMNVQANVPNTLPGQAVTFLLLGDTQITNQVAPEDAHTPADPIAVRVQSGGNVNLRSGPGTNTSVAAVIAPNTELNADALNDAGDWVRVEHDGALAWISRSLVTAVDDTGDVDALPPASVDAFTPMQAFYFTTGIGVSDCVGAPDSLVVQGPEDFSVDLQANGANFTIGSTVILTSQGETAPSAPAFESPFGPDAVNLFVTESFYVLPGGDDSLIITGGAPTPGGIALTSDIFLNPDGSDNLVLGTSPEDMTGINTGGVYVNPANNTIASAAQPADAPAGLPVTGSIFVSPAPGGVIVSFLPSPDDLPELPPGHPLADAIQPGNDDSPTAPGCRETQIIVLDGEAQLNDGALTVPLGHAADAETCFGEDGEIESQSSWDNLRQVDLDELRIIYGALENIPSGVLRYPVTIPSQDDVDRALAPPTPAPTLPPTDRDTPAPPQPSLGVDCSAFRSTSPSDGLAFGDQQFFWDAAPGAERYRVVVIGLDRPGQVSAEVEAPATNLIMNLGLNVLDTFGRGLNFNYVVQALAAVDGRLEVACESQVRTLNREFVSDEQLCLMLNGQWIEGECYIHGHPGPYDLPD